MLNAEEAMALRLYREMPGAPPIPHRDGQEMWGEVMGNQHFRFCEAVARMILDRIAQAITCGPNA